MSSRVVTRNVVPAAAPASTVPDTNRQKPGPTKRLTARQESELVAEMSVPEDVVRSADDDAEMEIVIADDGTPDR